MNTLRKKTSMQDIAEHLGISKNAVSMALNNKPGISESLRSRIIQAAAELNYGNYGLAHREQEGKTAAICVPNAISSGSQFYSAIYWSIEQQLREDGFKSLMISISPEMENNKLLPDLLDASEVNGLILVGIFQRSYVEFLQKLFTHIVIVDNFYLDFPLTAVVTANIEGGYTAVNYLISRGHRRIGFVGPIHRSVAYRERWMGYSTALDDAGLPHSSSLTYFDSVEDGFMNTPELIEKATESILKAEPDALFCANDRIAILLMGILTKKGIDVPQDISIIGFDDVEPADIVSPPLTTMRVHRVEMGRKAAALFIHKITNQAAGKTRSEIPANTVLYPTLIERESVK